MFVERDQPTPERLAEIEALWTEACAEMAASRDERELMSAPENPADIARLPLNYQKGSA